MILCNAAISIPNGTAVCEPIHKIIQFQTLPDLKQIITDSDEFVQGDLADFRRTADNVRLAQLGTILCASCFKDKWSPDGTALIGCNGDGCALNNRLFWNDFTAHGRDNGRASLFVPTLPSIPVCEAAITLGIHGPVRYLKASSQILLDEAIQDIFDSDNHVRQIMTVVLNNFDVRCELIVRDATPAMP